MLRIDDPKIEAQFRNLAYEAINRKPIECLEDWIKANLDDNYKGRQKWDNFLAIWQCYTTYSLNAKILDLGCGTGSVVFNAQERGFHAIGVEPEVSRIDLANQKNNHYKETGQLKIDAPPFVRAAGEKLPFKDNSIAAILNYQVIEHVKDLKPVLKECIRILEPGGLMYICAPDYLSFYEGHYNIFWFPLFPRKLAKIYLRLRKREPDFLDSITYTTNKMVAGYLKEWDVIIFDHRLLNFYRQFTKEIDNPDLILFPLRQAIYKAAKSVKLTETLEFVERWKARIKNRWIHLVVIKKPGQIKNSFLEKARVY